MDLFSPYTLGPLTLKNRVVMAPMTRSRAISNVPNALMAEYYGQRASAGLIVTEGTAPSPNGLGYPRIPELASREQVAGWKKVTEAVHAAGGRIFAQLMHTGRIAHVLNLPEGAEVVAPSAVAAAGSMFTDSAGPQPHSTPRAMEKGDIARATEEFAAAARNAIEAGFDGVELHAANGYLFEQFLNPDVNLRKDVYGGSIENRGRFVVETAAAVAAAIGAERTGIRLSPHSTFNDMTEYEEVVEQYAWLAERLADMQLVYLHLMLGAKRIPQATWDAVRTAFGGTLLVNSGFDRAAAEAVLDARRADLVSFGVPFIANPDLVARMRHGTGLADPRPDTFYTPGAAGYVDYPALAVA